jgi:arylsulfatase A-like enzyme
LLGCHSIAAAQPNVVLIYADDLGHKDLSSYGSEFYETPAIDRLLSRGVTFTQAYSCAPLCAPSRIALLTGRHCARVGCFEVANGFWNETKFFLKAKHGSTKGWDPNWEEKVAFRAPRNKVDLPRNHKLISEFLKERGYFTGFFGKWHVGPQKPADRGFDEFAKIETYAPGANMDTRKGRASRSPGYPKPEGHIGDYMARVSLQFIERAGDRPFFLYMSHPLVHTPLEAKAELVEKYRNKQRSAIHGHPVYAAMIEMLDESVGRVVAALEERDLLDNTLIIFTSDNGGMTGPTRQNDELGGYELGEVTSHHPLRGGKTQLWEGGIRIPMGMVYGDRFPRATFDGMVSQLDILPTLLELIGHPESDTAGRLSDGRSLMPILKNTDAEWEERSLFWHFPSYRGLSQYGRSDGHKPGFVQRPETAVHRGDWKLFQSLETGDIRLYNLSKDIGEKKDVAGEHPLIAESLLREIKAWQKETKAPMPIRKEQSQ